MNTARLNHIHVAAVGVSKSHDGRDTRAHSDAANGLIGRPTGGRYDERPVVELAGSVRGTHDFAMVLSAPPSSLYSNVRSCCTVCI